MHMKLPKRPFYSIALYLIELLPSSRGNTYVLTCIGLLKNYPIAISILDETAETVVQAYLQHIYAIFGRSLTLIMDNGKIEK